MIKFQRIILVLFVISIWTIPSIAAPRSGKCDRSCGGKTFANLPSPFGFSSGCQIQLNCTAAGAVVNEFPVQDFTPDLILVNLPEKCSRPVKDLAHLFGPNYAPTSHNGLLLRDCDLPVTPCLIPATLVQTHFELLNCSGSNERNNISCYAEANNQSLFIDYENVTRTTCRWLLSAISTELFANSRGVSMDVQVVQLGWWLDGNCEQCVGTVATCNHFTTPDKRPGYRCQCNEGFSGDGYSGGLGCRKDSSSCNLSKYLSGRCGGTTRVGVLVGGVAAGVSLMVSVGILCCFFQRRSHLKIRNRTKRRLCEATGFNIPIYPYKEIEKATINFSDQRRLGTGAYGTVYSGKLQNDEWVAIKRIKHRSDTNSMEQVMNEIKLLSSVSHPNLVRLLGCSIEKGEQILVYEFMPNGTLSQHLHREKGNGLAWPIRLTIATETAQAIAYLHSEMNPPIYHRDIKSSNILLDYNYKTKVADFGLSRLGIIELSHISTAPQGTPGYLDPQYHQNFHLSDKSDVYSFGVVLVEIITALKAVDFLRRQNEVSLASLAVDRIANGCLDKIIDPFFKENLDDWTLMSIHKVAELAFRCLAFQSEMRPSMVEVAAELERIKVSRWESVEESIKISSEAFSFSSSSNVNDKQLNMNVNKPELRGGGIYESMTSVDSEKKYSPVSVMQDPWPSEHSSPSSNNLLSNVIQ